MEAHERALALLKLYDRDPDHLSPDEQALVLAIRELERVGQDVIAALHKKIALLEPEQD